MIFILTEQSMNGTVTMSVATTLIEAETAEQAFEKLTKFPNWGKAEGIHDDGDSWTYSISANGGFGCWGKLNKKPAKIVK